MIIHAPRTGEDVAKVSMYYWIAPELLRQAVSSAASSDA